jgi:hypothetical protein
MDGVRNLQETKGQLRLPTKSTIEKAASMIDPAGYIIYRKLNKETAKMHAPAELLNMVPIFYMNKNCRRYAYGCKRRHSNFDWRVAVKPVCVNLLNTSKHRDH